MTQPIPETDLVKIAEREVVAAAKAWMSTFQLGRVSLVDRFHAQRELLTAVTLLTAREGAACARIPDEYASGDCMAATIHLDDERGQQ